MDCLILLGFGYRTPLRPWACNTDAIIVGVGKGAENGILIKTAESLEKLHKINRIVVDKTGTITKGKPVVTDIILAENTEKREAGQNANHVLSLLVSHGKNSEHPLAVAVVEKAIKAKA